MYSNDTSNDEVIPIPQPIQPTNQEIEPIIHRKADYTFQSHSRGVSKHSAFSFVSNFSSLNRKNLRRCGRSKASFMLMNAFNLFGALAMLIFSLLVFTNVIPMSALWKLWRTDALQLLTSAAMLQLLTSMLGFYGAIRHQKYLLVAVMLFVWPIMGIYITSGYLTYKDAHSSKWDLRLSEHWDSYPVESIATIQDVFQCCGYLSHFDRPVAISTCDAFGTASNSTTSGLQALDTSSRDETNPSASNITNTIYDDSPGCYSAWNAFSFQYLSILYIISFFMVPFCLIMFVTSILAANHIYND